MVATPQDQSILARLDRIEKALANVTSKTLYAAAIGQGGITVQQGGSITMKGGNFSLADSTGDILVQNDTVTGWGLNQPNLSTPFSQVNTDAAIQNPNRDGLYYLLFYARHIINHPKVSFGGDLLLSSSTGNISWAVEWWTSPPLTIGTGTVMTSGGPFSVSTLVNGNYTWPSNMFGQLVYVGYSCALSVSATAGDWASIVPTYFYGHGG